MRLWHLALAAAVAALAICSCEQKNVTEAEMAGWYALFDGGHVAGADAGPAGTDAGAVWSPVTPLPPVASYDLNAIAGADPTLMAVGASGLVLSYQGGNWQQVGNVPTTNDLRAVSFESSTSAWIVGAGGTVLHWNGTGFDDHSFSADGGPRPDFNAVHVQNGIVWAAGNGARWRYVIGTNKWTDHSDVGDVTGLWGDGTATWASDLRGEVYQVTPGTDAGVMLIQSKPPLHAIHGFASIAWVVGDGEVIHFDTTPGVVDITAQTGPVGSALPSWRAVHVASPQSVWIASARNVMAHWNGTNWETIAGYDDSSPGSEVRGVWTSPQGTWAVGNQLILELKQ